MRHRAGVVAAAVVLAAGVFASSPPSGDAVARVQLLTAADTVAIAPTSPAATRLWVDRASMLPGRGSAPAQVRRIMRCTLTSTGQCARLSAVRALTRMRRGVWQQRIGARWQRIPYVWSAHKRALVFSRPLAVNWGLVPGEPDPTPVPDPDPVEDPVSVLPPVGVPSAPPVTGDEPQFATAWVAMRGGPDNLADAPTWGRCAVIGWRIDTLGLSGTGSDPAAEVARWQAAFEQASAVTGYVFNFLGTADGQINLTQRPPRLEQPVIDITYGSPDRTDAYAYDLGGIAGMAGPDASFDGSGPWRYTGGHVLINSWTPRTPLGSAMVLDVYMHELGHVLGLGHTTEPTQLMYPTQTVAKGGYRLGDRTGLSWVANLPAPWCPE